MAKQYNEEASKHGWTLIKNPHLLELMPTRIPCIGDSIEEYDLNQKVTRHLPDQFIMEYDSFFHILSYYLPAGQLRNNENFA